MDPRVKPEDDEVPGSATLPSRVRRRDSAPLACRAFVVRKAKQLALRPLRGPLLNPHKGSGGRAARPPVLYCARDLAMIRALLAALLLTSPAFAADMSVFVRNQRSDGVAVELFSRDSEKVWPGDDKVFLIRPKAKKSVPIPSS